MNQPGARGYDRLAKAYRALEFVAFGRDLERARYCFLPTLKNCRAILILGEGDGRCLAQLVRHAPEARIDVVDMSAGMLSRAAQRFAGREDITSRLRLIEADALTREYEQDHYDAVLTHFFLDCFTASNVEALVQKVRPSLRPGASWLFADFAIPQDRGLIANWRARAWLAVLIRFFAWQTKHPVRVLPPSEEILEKAGFRREQLQTFQTGLVRSALFIQPGSRT